MSAELLSPFELQPAQQHDMYDDPVEREHLLDAVELLMQMQSDPDLQRADHVRLKYRRQELVEDLISERPGHTLLNEVLLLASLYEGRMTEAVLPEDGSRVRAFGTRDKHGIYLEESYVMHEKPDGGFYYLARRLEDGLAVVYELDDQAGLRITRMGNDRAPAYHQPFEYPEGSPQYQEAASQLLQSSLDAVAQLGARSADEARRIDADAKSHVESDIFARRFLDAPSSEAFMAVASSLHGYRHVELSPEMVRLLRPMD